MNWKRQFAMVAMLTLVALHLYAGDVIDSIVATVGKHAILQSELDEAVRFEMFSAGRPLRSVTNQDVKAALDHLIDRQLIMNDTGETDAFAPTREDVEKRIREIRAQVPGAGSDEEWRALLQEYGMSNEIVGERVRSQLETMRIVNQKLRPAVRITQADVEAAYRDEFLPKIREAGGKESPLSEISSRIRQVLVERHISELLEIWLQGLHSQTEIRENIGGSTPDGTNGDVKRVTDSAKGETKNVE